MLMRHERSAENTLSEMIENITEKLDELSEFKQGEDEFIDGERYAYAECLEMITAWIFADKHGLDFDVEKKYMSK